MPEPATRATPVIELPTTGTGSAEWWRAQTDWTVNVRTDKLKEWRTNANAYRDRLIAPSTLGVRVNIEFEKTEQKRHQLFYRVPALALKASPRTIRESFAQLENGQPDSAGTPRRDLKKAIQILREVLSYELGPKGANTKALMDELIFDILCPAGIGFSKVWYQRYVSGTVPVQTGWKETPALGDVIGLSAPVREPVMGEGPNILAEKYGASRISPARGLVPMEFTGSDYNLADFLGHEFPLLPEIAVKRGWWREGDAITPDAGAAVEQSDRIVMAEHDTPARRTGQIKCREMFYFPQRLGLHDNPDLIRRLVFCGSNNNAPVVHENYRDQRFDARGRFIGGLKTNPIKVLTIRYISDYAWPESDCQITRRPSDELAEFRTQGIKHRRKAAPRSVVNVSVFANEQQKEKFLRGEHYDDIAVLDGQDLDRVAKPITTPNIPPDNIRTELEIKADIDRAWAMPQSASAQTEGGSTTATEISAMQQATANRLGGEREKVLAFWLSIAESISALIQLYADREAYVEIVGADGAAAIEAWDKETIKGEFLFNIVPDSSSPPDAAADRDLALNRYNLLANSRYVDQLELARETVDAYGGDETDRLVTEPPAPPVEKPKLSVSINGKDLDPEAPQYANVVKLLALNGVEDMAPAPEAPGDQGPAAVVDRERLRMAEADEGDRRGGGLVGAGAVGRGGV